MIEPISAENCTASELIDDLGQDMDFMVDAVSVRWKCYLTPLAYSKIKNDPAEYIYEKDGHEYVKAWENTTIPFIIDIRIAGIEEVLLDKSPNSLGCRCVIDDDN